MNPLTISIKNSSNSDKDFNFVNDNSLNILFEKIKSTYEEHCKSGNNPKKTVTLTEKGIDTWTITTDSIS